MGNKQYQPYDECNATSTAREVYEYFSEGKENFLSGKTAIVTGGNSGIGLETCKVLAYGGAKVIMCSRSVTNGLKAIDEEIKQLGEGGYIVAEPNIEVKELDLNSLHSIMTFAEYVLRSLGHIDYLIYNAGIMALPTREETKDGFEKQIGVNHFGHFYLTKYLRDRLNAQKEKSRIIVLSSSAHSMSAPNMDVDDLHFSKGRTYGNWVAYGQSKLANMLFAKELADQFEDSKKPIKVMSVHPGVIQTALWRSTGLSWGLGSVILGKLMANKTIPQGAATTIWACLNPYVEEAHTDEDKLPINGAYLYDCGPQLPATADGIDAEKKLRKALWMATNRDLNEVLPKLMEQLRKDW